MFLAEAGFIAHVRFRIYTGNVYYHDRIMYRVTKLITANFSPVSPVVVGSQFQEEKEDVQRKLVILQDDLEKNEARADALHKEAQEKAGALDETERYV